MIEHQDRSSFGEALGYVLEVAGMTVYHAGHTDQLDEMADLGDVDVVFLPIGGTFTMDIAKAVEAAKLLALRYAVPMHTLRRADPAEFAARLTGSAVEPRVLRIGGPLLLMPAT